MRAIVVFCLFIILAFLVGAVLAYPLKLLLDPALELAYRKYLTYATLISGLIVSGFYLQFYNLLSFSAFGYNGKISKFLKNMLTGFVYGIAIMLIIEFILLLLGIHEIDSTRSYSFESILLVLAKAILVGLLIAILEESIFRGGLFTGLYKQTGTIIATLFSSLIYAAVHFVRYKDLPDETDVDLFTGLAMLPYAFRRYYEWYIVDYFLTLFVFGVLLSLMRLKHNSIAACIGVHAGVVMLIKTSKYFTNTTPESNYDYLVSQYNSTFGWLSFIVISLFALFYFVKLVKK